MVLLRILFLPFTVLKAKKIAHAYVTRFISSGLASPSFSAVSSTGVDTSDGVRNIGVEHCGWLMKMAGMPFKPRCEGFPVFVDVFVASWHEVGF